MEEKRPFLNLDWAAPPDSIKRYIIMLEDIVNRLQDRQDDLETRTEKLKSSIKKNSQNSSKPPSSDSHFKKLKRKKSARKRGAQKGHKGHQQQLLKPTKVKKILPRSCPCGCQAFDLKSIQPFYIHQHIELPEIKMDVEHYILHKGRCKNCGAWLTHISQKMLQAVMGQGRRL